MGKIIKAAWGLEAIKIKAASPIVLIRVARTELNETIPRVYILITIIAPPQPGITPNNAQIGISNFEFFLIYSGILKFFFSKVYKTRSVALQKK